MNGSLNNIRGGMCRDDLHPATLVDLLRWRGTNQAQCPAYTFLSDGETEEIGLTYGELDRQARSIAVALQSLRAVGERVLLVYPAGLEYVAAFFGCLYAGAVAVPAYPARQNSSFQRLESIVTDARPVVALTTSTILSKSKSRLSAASELNNLRWVATDDCDVDLSREWREPELGSESLAFLQYTSGSTALPKGVMISHGNLLHNEGLIRNAFRQGPESVIVGWLPLYHDMGLIGNVIQTLFSGARCVLMSPMAFLQSPFRWLNAISRYRATTSGGPNFAYELCVDRITAAQREHLDLSSWSVAYNGAEPVRAATVERFTEVFGPCGFRREAFRPCFGLAESTLLVSVSANADSPVIKNFDAGELVNNRICEVAAGEKGSKALVGCGRELAGQKIAIVAPESLTPCEQDRVGEVWVSSRSVAQGYWNRSEETAAVFGARVADTDEGPFLRTGDLGFIRNGELFITGRLKDLIIIRGMNHYPQDIELTVERSHAALRPGCGAAFSIEVAGEDRLVIVQEVEPRRLQEAAGALEVIRLAVTREHEVQPHAIALIKAGGILKTSSGKIQRSACRARFLERRLDVVAEWTEKATTEGEAQARSRVIQPRDAKEIEFWLVSQLAERLGIDPSAIDVNYSLPWHGLDSLAAVELMYGMECTLGVSLPLISFLQEPSIASLSAQAAAYMGRRTDGDAAPANGENATTCRLSHGQRAMWFMRHLAPDSPAYNITVPMRVRGRLDVAAMRRAFQAIIERHECLRSSFEVIDGEPVQIVREASESLFDEVDITTWDDDEVSDYLVEEAYRPYDLQAGPLLRIKLLRRSPEEHILQFSAHHIVADFWSLDILIDELGVLYHAEKTGSTPVLTPLLYRYRDYSVWQAEMLAGAGGERLRSYWKKQLAGELPTLNLPYDKARPAIQTFHGASEELRLDMELNRALKALGQAHDATLYMTLLAAFQVLLRRYTGQDDLLVGSVTAGRGRAEWTGVVGYFANPVALRADLSGNPTFESFLTQVRQTVLSALGRQDYPFAVLVEELQPERDLSRSPLFQVMFVLQKTHLVDKPGLTSFALGRAGGRFQMGDLVVESLSLKRQVTQYELVMMAAETEDGLVASIRYNADLFYRETIVRMLGHFCELLRSVVADPAGRISDLNILPATERRQLLSEWNETDSCDFAGKVVNRMFEEQAVKTPDATAVSFGAARLSYRELNERANKLANRLLRFGVRPETLVGVCLERSVEMVVAVLSVLKTGGAYVPLDPSYPAERLRLTLEDSGAVALLTCHTLGGVFGELDVHVIYLDCEWEAIARESEVAPAVEVSGDNLAYMIYTSGSTGSPKGVAVQHAGLANLVAWHQLAYGVTAGDRATLLAGPAFDASVWELWPYLTAGASIHIADEAIRASSADLLKWLSAEAITVSFLPTALAEAVLAERLPADLTLRAMLTGGDKLQRAPRQSLSFTLVNHYGPTEYTVVATRAPVVTSAEYGATPPIGRPIANTQAYLLDPHFQVAPLGSASELCLGGVGLARGYHGRTGLTAERFIPNQFGREPGARLYRTGDMARYLPDGNLEFLSRADNQVKIRGFRIELGDVEAALSLHPAVRHVVALAREESPGDSRLIAYIVPAEQQAVTASELRKFLKEKLPEYMVPSAFVWLETLPLTPNGKIDRRALPAPGMAILDPGAAHGHSNNPVEEILAGIWAEVLKVERVGVNDNFFELGGHSLLAVQVTSRVKEYFQVELPLRSLFEWPTVSALAVQIEAAMKVGRQSQIRPIMPVPREGALPLSFAQQRLWFLDRLAPGAPFYNISGAARLKGGLVVAALEQSLNEIVRRHESLRTTFATRQGVPRQVIPPSLRLPLPCIDLSALPDAERESEAQRLTDAEARHGFDLAAGPLIRAGILKLSEAEHTLMLTMHHIVSDGRSMEIFIEELKALYEAFSSGKESPLAEPTIQYADYAHWQKRMLDEGALETELVYWRQRLGGAQTALAMPTDRPRPPIQTYNGSCEAFALHSDLNDRLNAISLGHGATLFMTLLAAFKALLYRYTGQTDIIVGTPVAGRDNIESENVIGFFVNTLALRSRVSGGMSFRQLLGGVREASLEAFVHQKLPFEKLVEELQPQRDTSHAPLAQVMFAMRNAPSRTLEFAGLSMEQLPPKSVSAKFELLLMMEKTPEGLSGRLEYNTDLFDRATGAHFIEHFQVLLSAAIETPDLPISELRLLTESEIWQLLVEFNRTERDYPLESVHRLFEAQAARTPDRVAVVCGDQRVSFGELNRRANRVARRLKGLGLGMESLVGVCLRRRVEMVTGLLGALKAGCAYVPLDPNYPQERLRLTFEDSGAKALLTERGLLERLPVSGARALCLDAESERWEDEGDENPGVEVLGENLAYVIYTSGSTGRPKGVGITQRGAWTLIQWAYESFEMEDLAGVLASTSICFDLSVYELFVPLGCGGKLILVENGLALGKGEELGEVRLINTVPSVIAELVSAGAVPKGARVVNLAGEALTSKLVDEVYGQLQVREVNNLYGPTEDTTYSTAERVEWREGREPTIGRPIANTAAYVLDASQGIVPVGVTGELYLSGEGLARGYLNRPELTAEKFICNPFSREGGARMYRTGDLSRHLRDGRIEFLGRADHQVKIRGFRIELGEIESALAIQEGVREAVVLARDDDSGGKRLVAYVVPEQGKTVSISELRRGLREKLPEYMAPSAFVQLEAFPQTPNGKVDRKALPAPSSDRPDVGREYVAPRTPTEDLVAGIWRESLGLELVGVHDNFFELGGHSLLAAQIMAKVSEAVHTELPLIAIFESPTVEGLAAAVERAVASETKRPAPVIRKFSREAFKLKASTAQGLKIPEIIKK